jgi:signal transduction histidine kinase/ActR/RegA family two-component response regulator
MSVADVDSVPLRKGAPGGIWRSLQRTGLGVRLAVLSAALAALVTFGTFAALSVQVRTSTREHFAEELSRNGRTLVALQRDSRRHLVLTAELLAESPTLRSAIATYRVESQSGSSPRPDLTMTVQRELERLGSALPGGALLATDEKGRVFAGYARGTTAPMQGTNLSALPAVRNALDPSVVTSDEEAYLSGLEVGDRYFGVGAAPLILDGYTIGSIVFGERVDSNVVKSLRRDFQGDVVISAGSKIISSTMPPADASLAIRDPGQTGTAIRLGDEEYLASVIALGRTQRGTDLRITLLQPLSPAVRTLRSALLTDFLLYGALAVLLAALGAAVLTRSLLQPLRRFIRFMRAGADQERVDHAFDAEDASQEIRLLNDSFNQLMVSLDGKRFELERRGSELAAANEVLTDEIRQRERVEQALRESEAQLRQSQKLEAIGTLAGGIAHDFNNMLTVISGFTQMALRTLGHDHEVAGDLKQVSDAAHSAAGLTHQLLAFSRKQVMQPRVLDLEYIVSGMEGMVRRLIGPHITLEVTHTGDSSRIKADPGQIEQVLLNLAVNARDAMPDGGALTIITAQRVSDVGAECVVLQVGDTGVGMTPAVRDRIFEPFFTTKEVGKGTGLGLSTVYGIVVQSGASIEVESELGLGTTFTVVFPLAGELMTVDLVGDDDSALPRGTETVLLVDDEDAVRAFARRTLESCGYTVLEARGGVEALTLAPTTPRVDLLLTDVLMPQLTGPQLVERFIAKYPAPIIVYMTGYVDDVTMQLELNEEALLLRKPFSASDLARVVRTSLDGRRTPARQQMSHV